MGLAASALLVLLLAALAPQLNGQLDGPRQLGCAGCGSAAVDGAARHSRAAVSSQALAAHVKDASSGTALSLRAPAEPGPGPDCYTAPTDPACADFRQPDETSEKEIEMLCSMMPGMIGCTLWATCQNGTSSGRFCAPFSVLGDICADMPSMRGCEGFLALCALPASRVRQCREEGPVRHVLLSDDTTAAILGMCSTHAMPQCADCTSRYKCPDPMSTISALCLAMPGMSACAKFFEMCAEAGQTFRGLCQDAGAGDLGLPPMKMYLHQSLSDIILLKAWVPRSPISYAASCAAVLLSALLVQALKAWRVSVERGWLQSRRGLLGCGPGRSASAAASDASGLQAPLLKKGGGTPATTGRVQRNAVRAAFTVVIVFLDYMLMLVVMTFNIGIIAAAVAGFGLGALLYGHVGEPESRQGSSLQETLVPGALVGAPDPDPENSLEVQFVPTTGCSC